MRLHAVLVVVLLCAGACSRSKMADYYVLTSQPFDAAPGKIAASIGISGP